MNIVKRFLCSTQCHRGAAAITAILFFVIISTVFVLGLSAPVAHDYTTARDLGSSKSSYYLSEAGQEDVMYRIRTATPVDSEEILSLNGDTVTTAITNISPTEKEVNSTADVFENFRRSAATLSKTIGVSFHYGMQVGGGGLNLLDHSIVYGNVYSNGPVVGDEGTLDDEYIDGDLIVAGTNNADEIHLNGTFYGNDISNSYVGGDAYYNNMDVNTTVLGTKYSGTPNQPEATFPITDSMIAQWKTVAEAGGVTDCPGGVFSVSGSVTYGPQKFMDLDGGSCHLIMGLGDTLTLTGPIWVYGDITIGSNAVVKISPSLVGESVAFIADGDPAWVNEIDVDDTTTFVGSGTNSYVTLISTDDSPVYPAINMWNDVSGDLIVFAPYGEITISGNVRIKEVSAYKVGLSGYATIEYQTGLGSLLFNSGPTGGWWMQDWKLGQ